MRCPMRARLPLWSAHCSCQSMGHLTLLVPLTLALYFLTRRDTPPFRLAGAFCGGELCKMSIEQEEEYMSECRPNVGLGVLCLLVFLQILCFFTNVVENFFATIRMTFVGHKGAALVKPVAQLQNVAQVGNLLTGFYLICCLLFFVLLIGMAFRKPIFFRILLVLDVISLCLGLYGYYFWMTGGAGLTALEQAITLTEPFLSSGGLVLLLFVPAVRRLWWPHRG